MKFSDMIVLVAGGTGGLGQAVSLAFLEEGAKVIVTYRNEAEYTALQGAAGTNASNLEGQSVDITDELAVANFANDILSRYATVDAVVNTIGGYAGGINLWN